MTIQTRKLRWLYLLIPLCVGLALLAYYMLAGGGSDSNSLLVLEPYRRGGTWVFDDPNTSLKAEPFINGIPKMIDKLLADAKIENADSGFRLIFSAREFPGFQDKIVWRRSDMGGNWYYSPKYDMEGWLCPALLKYFRKAPPEIYVKVESR